MIGSLVYLLCAATSWTCAVLLLRAHGRHPARLLFWSGAGFCFIGASNLLLFVDRIVVPGTDLTVLRSSLTLAGLCLLLWGLIGESSSR